MSSTETAVAIRMQDLSPEYAEIMVLGNVLQKSGYFKDVRDQAQAVAKILYGRELGFSPIISMSGIHIIEGKPAISANLLAAMIKRSGKYDYRVVRWSDEECVLMFRQKVGDKWEELGESSFSMEDAKRARVIREGSGWAKFPKAMLFARAISQGERAYCPDVSACALYVPEELGATVNESGEVTELPASVKAASAAESVPLPDLGPLPEPNGGQALSVTPEAEVSKTEAPATAEPEFCSKEQQDWLRLQFKDALPVKYQADADQLRRDFLKGEGFVDDKGRGTSKAIPYALFKAAAKKCINHAKSIKELAAK